ncbi:fasciclin domain-containing protein [Xylanibacter muris]|uniref:FAS1 domain-containing protein n=1 Tax=Xylanibacter muris TaxID=2736290 RepID=A0ABX2ALC4_9BACT|nr:fasciclin domain-containing protein [Xylanibacter muris]NPD92001.1 hypothetical protein [Xylanibacter muris]
MNNKKYIYGMMAAATLLAASCSDFDDYNKAYTEASVGSQRTLWENIKENKDLSQFAELVVKAGFANNLNSSRSYTVWAPLNDSFDYSKYLSMDSAALRKTFVENHIANFNHAMTGETVDKRVHTLNNKSYQLVSDGDGYLFDGKNMTSGTGIPSVNGTLHTISGVADFLPNIYESLENYKETETDSIYSYFMKFKTSVLDVNNSIEGPIVNGKQTYIDSVMIESNDLFGRYMLDADISNEDSSYTLILPTNKAYIETYKKIKECYKLPKTIFWKEISSQYNGVAPNDSRYEVETENITAEQVQDSLSRLLLVTPLTLSNNNTYNLWVTDREDAWQRDTLRSTVGVTMPNGPEIINDHLVGEPMEMSNGFVRIVDSLAYRPWNIWNPAISVSLHNPRMRPYVNGTAASVSTITVHPDNIDMDKIGNIFGSNGMQSIYTSYLDFRPGSSGDRAKPEAYFYLDNIRSTTYNVYVVFVPARYDKTTKNTPEKNYKISLQFCYGNGQKTVVDPKMTIESTDSNSVQMVKAPKTVTFPYSYAVAKDCYPYVKLQSERSTISQKEWAKYDNHLRIAAIILRPVEYDEYLNSLNSKE